MLDNRTSKQGAERVRPSFATITVVCLKWSRKLRVCTARHEESRNTSHPHVSRITDRKPNGASYRVHNPTGSHISAAIVPYALLLLKASTLPSMNKGRDNDIGCAGIGGILESQTRLWQCCPNSSQSLFYMCSSPQTLEEKRTYW